jgi:hypothetical protein
MGSSSSKAGRILSRSTTSSKPQWTGARTQGNVLEGESTSVSELHPTARRVLAKEVKDEG